MLSQYESEGKNKEYLNIANTYHWKNPEVGFAKELSFIMVKIHRAVPEKIEPVNAKFISNNN